MIDLTAWLLGSVRVGLGRSRLLGAGLLLPPVPARLALRAGERGRAGRRVHAGRDRAREPVIEAIRRVLWPEHPRREGRAGCASNSSTR